MALFAKIGNWHRDQKKSAGLAVLQEVSTSSMQLHNHKQQ